MALNKFRQTVFELLRCTIAGYGVDDKCYSFHLSTLLA